MDKLQIDNQPPEPGTVVQPIELPPGADASLGLAYGQEIVIDEAGNRRVVNREIGRRASRPMGLTY